MSGLFRGPSLFTHVLILAVSLAVTLPLLAEWLGSFGKALLLGLGFAFCYAICALLWGSRKMR